MTSTNTFSFGFFGSSSFSIYVLDELERASFLPKVVITMPDKRKGRDSDASANEVKVWAEKRNIPVLTPEKIKDPIFGTEISAYGADVFVVASYGKIIPENILYTPKHKTLNVHPSLLPKYRGASPIQSMILADEKHTGITIMELDAKMDEGPIVTMKEIMPPIWPVKEEYAKEFFGHEGGKLLASILLDWATGAMTKTTPQDHPKATYTKKITKEDGLLDMQSKDPKIQRQNHLKVLAYHEWPKAYFFDDFNGKKIRVVVTEAEYTNNELVIKKVIPEGKREMAYEDYMRGKRV